MAATISARDLAECLRSNPELLLFDVRTPEEYRGLHVRGARNLPIGQLDPATLATQHPTGPLYFICQMGGRSGKACEKMLAAGYDDVVNVEGGTDACVEAGLQVVRGAS